MACTRSSTSSSTTTCRSSTEFRDELNKLEQDIFAETYRRDTIVKLYDLKRELTQLRLAVAPLQDILSQLIRVHSELMPKEVRPYFRDVLDHAMRVNEATDTMREMITAAMGVNLSLVTINQGEVVKKLAGWAALLAAPTLITSWYGMNFQLHARTARPLQLLRPDRGRGARVHLAVSLPAQGAVAVERRKRVSRHAAARPDS